MSHPKADRRLHYLQRMGVDAWQMRKQSVPAIPVPTAADPVAVEQLSASVVVAPAIDPAAQWEALVAEVAGCRRCTLCESRTQTVLGVGHRSSRLLVVGEAPGADEDRQGEPFVGRAGQLLDQMLRAMGWPRERVYIANLLKCRPPGNRDPQPDEVAACEPYLQRQLELVQPGLVLAVGRIAAQQLLKTSAPIASLRGKVQRYGPAATPLVVTYHPAYLLRSPKEKAKAWQDLKLARAVLAGG